MAFAILPLILLLLLFGGLVLGIILWVSGGRSRSSGAMACGGCGYAVRGLEALNCPECGADLRQVGINRGQSGGSRVFGIVLTVCCGGVLLLGCLGSAFLFVGLSPSSIQSGPVQAYPTQPSTSTSSSTLPIVIEDESPGDSEDSELPEHDSSIDDEPTP